MVTWFLHHGLADTGLKRSYRGACSNAYAVSYACTGAELSNVMSSCDSLDEVAMWDHIFNHESVVVTATHGSMRWMAFTKQQDIHPRLLVELMFNLGEGRLDELIEEHSDE